MERLLDKLSVPTPGQMRNLRAVELLELVGRAYARQVLVSLADGLPSARMTQEAKGGARAADQTDGEALKCQDAHGQTAYGLG